LRCSTRLAAGRPWRDPNAQLEQQFVVDPLFARQRILPGHPANQPPEFLWNRRSTRSRLESPQQPPACAMPTDHSRRLHNDQSAAPLEQLCQNGQADSDCGIYPPWPNTRSMNNASWRRRKRFSAWTDSVERNRSTTHRKASWIRRPAILARSSSTTRYRRSRCVKHHGPYETKDEAQAQLKEVRAGLTKKSSDVKHRACSAQDSSSTSPHKNNESAG
jgi:hypothetical protein